MGRLWNSFALRVSIAVLTRTFFQPDEFFQSLEVAHRVVFGYGHFTWEWLAQVPIRSVAFPLLYSPAFYIVKWFHLDDTPFLIILPKIIAGLLAALADVAVYDLAVIVWGRRYANTALFLSWSSFFNALALTRTLSNSVETTITAVALKYWLRYFESIDRAMQAADSSSNQREDVGALVTALSLAALTCIVRPTNAVLTAFIVLQLFFHARHRIMTVGRILIWCIWLGNFAIGVVFSIDSEFYKRPMLTPLNFLITNLSSVSLFYGNNPWHYYLSQGLPIVTTTALPFTLHGMYTAFQRPSPFSHSRRLMIIVAGTLAVYSVAGHKEWRFIHPLLPVLHVFAAKSLVDLHDRHLKRASDDEPKHDREPLLPVRRRYIWLLLLNIPPSLYVMLLHGAAQISVVHHLRTRQDLRSVGFLMPCHSTPWQSHLHRQDLEGQIWALGCEPPLRGENLTTYRDQTRVFYDDPVVYLRKHFPRRVDKHFPPSPLPSTPPGRAPVSWSHSWPSHLVLFGALLEMPEVKTLLTETGYREDVRFVNGFEEDEKRRGGIQLWRWNATFETRFVTS
ncbi:Alg9-like mannosyltransferase family-domain-containing protein [Auriculariales sp. MPI-PUGE-AT-0066]|nr:Alg9-like mannosyltransferase family-domain-containing protein [Auriculariales sp. MPI-PUGE-AT-0066]